MEHPLSAIVTGKARSELPYEPFIEALGTYIQACDPRRVNGWPRVRVSPTWSAWFRSCANDSRHAAAAQATLKRIAGGCCKRPLTCSAMPRHRHPLLLVLEDLQDADRGTLDLLLYLARNLHGSRLLVLGTYRDVEVDRAHPLSAALTELHRASNFARIHLRGLSRDEVLRLLRRQAARGFHCHSRSWCTDRRMEIPCSCTRCCAM